ncbi:hypothetical protein F5Y15DRAFT_429670 [Xylariaceae sp. FL0016]|nr:hypothetical protein F5Y15DRAFT_429670 [Xylariaceae sp. FL0016]
MLPSVPIKMHVVTSLLMSLATLTQAYNYPYDPLNLTCPPPDSGDTLTTPTNAPAPQVHINILSFLSYPLWNTFIPKIQLPSNVTSTPRDDYIPMPMIFTSTGIINGLNTTSNEILTIMSPSPSSTEEMTDALYYLGAWRFDDGLGGIDARAEHLNVVVNLGNGSSRYLSYETYYEGLLTPAIALTKDKLQKQFEKQGLDLKVYTEGM